VGHREKLAMERDLLGVYVSGHPLADVVEQITSQTNCNAAHLSEQRDGDEVTVGGIITEVIPRTTKNGQAMAEVTLEDLTGVMTLTVFPKVYTNCKSCIMKDRIVLVRGRVSLKEGNEDAEESAQAEVMVANLQPLESVEEGHAPVIHVSAPDAATAEKANWIFASVNGDTETVFHVEGETPSPGLNTALRPQIIKDALAAIKRYGGSIWVE
jgi:DNA polymerase III alpha subunit